MSDFLVEWKKYKRSGGFYRDLKRKKPNILQVIDNAETNNVQQSSSNNYEDEVFFEEAHINDNENQFPFQEGNDNYETVLCDNCDNDGFRNDVKQWSIDENIPQSSLKRLLDIFHKRIPNVFPRDPRTLLQTPISQIEIRTIGEGVNTEQYWHYGLEKSLKLQLKNLKKSTTISLNVNMDGLPLHESSRHEFWPILASIHEMSGAPPMIIGIYYGVGKPNDVKWFLTPFISELQNILDKGIIIDGVDGDSVHIRVQLRAFICDSPARAYVKGVTYCNGQHGCHKCTTVGEWSYETNCNIFPHTFSEKRNDADFRSKNYSSHIKMESPLQVLPINMVEDFVTSDELHLLHLGEMKKLLLKWRDGKFKNKVVKWTAQQISNISQEMEKFKLPSECHRSVRGLDYLSVWKGVEFRNFLHYVGIVILKDIVPESVYEHFLRLFGAVTICSSENYKNLLDIAHQMLCDYVELYKKIYGKDYIISNVHNLVHIVDDVKRFGILQTISSYPFENELYKIKNLLRTGHKPLQQVAKRIIEKSQTQIFNDNVLEKTPILKKRTDVRSDINNLCEGAYINAELYCAIEINSFALNANFRDKWFLTNKKDIVEFKYALKSENNAVLIYGRRLRAKEDFFIRPYLSSSLNVFMAHSDFEIPKVFRISEIKCKLVALPYEKEKIVFIPLIHTIEKSL